MTYSYKGEFLYWKNKLALLKSADLENPQVRRSLMKIDYANYCRYHKNANINRESTEAVFKFMRGVKEKNKDIAEEGIKDGLINFKKRLPAEIAKQIKTEDIWK